MTQNQLQYQANLEAQRANEARELETARANKAKEKETKRANKAKETLAWADWASKNFVQPVTKILNPLSWIGLE